MRVLMAIQLLILATMSTCVQAQTYTIQEMANQRRMAEGDFPSGWEEMVRASQIIIKGKFGKLLSHGQFYGYDEEDGSEVSIETYAARRNISVEHARRRSGLPLVEYEILVDEVVKSDLTETGYDTLGDKLVFRAYISAPEKEVQYFDPSLERMFFLYFNEDGITVSAPHEKAILNHVNGEYVYYMLNDERMDNQGFSDRYAGRHVNFDKNNEYSLETENNNFSNIERIIKDEVSRQEAISN